MSVPQGLPPVGIVVVHYGSWEPTRAAVASLAQAAPGAPLVVVDNGPGPAPPAARADMRVIRSDRNLGFGAACNRGAAEVAGDFLLFANNDVAVEPDAVDRLRDRLARDAGLAAAGPLFLDESKAPRRSVRRSPSPWRVLCENLFFARVLGAFPVFQGHHTLSLDETRPRDVDTLLGALFLVRRAAFESVGGFDESYFFYAEESDLFTRLARRGWRLAFEPSARVVHLEGAASAEVDRLVLDLWLREGLLRYAERFHGRSGRAVSAAALTAGAALRWGLSWVPGLPGGRDRRARYAAVLRNRRIPASRERAGERPA